MIYLAIWCYLSGCIGTCFLFAESYSKGDAAPMLKALNMALLCAFHPIVLPAMFVCLVLDL